MKAHMLPLDVVLSLTRTFVLIVVVLSAPLLGQLLPPCLCNTPENRDALIALYNATSGPSWSSPWNTSATVCEWSGVGCNGVGNVTSIALGQRGLLGTLPLALAALTMLVLFNISSNQISGTLPQSYSVWSRLTQFHVYNNMISGTLPSEYNNWTQLVQFLVYNNYITGTLPGEYGSWTLLTYFASQFNEIIGTLPATFGAWTKLTSIDVSYNNIFGTLPAVYGAWTQLILFGLSHNKIDGSLPATYGAWTLLSTFSVHSNNITGTLPTEYSAWTLLTGFHCFLNHISGTLPQSYSAWSRLSRFQVYNNMINGTLPYEFSNWTQLLEFAVYGNNFTGTLPVEYSTWTLLTEFHCFLSNISGTLPQSYSAWSRLTRFQVYNNMINGTLPYEFSNWTQVFEFAVANNNITGTLPDAYGAWTHLAVFRGQNNSFSGSLVSSYSRWTALTNFAIDKNNFDGSLPTSYAAWTVLTNFSVGSNNLSGTLPPEYGAWKRIAAFDVQKNQLSGTLPFSYGAWSEVVQFAAASNQLSGTLPEDWSGMRRLQELYLHVNHLSGTLPSSFSALSALLSLNFAANNFVGTVPALWGYNWPPNRLLGLSLQNNAQLIGTIPASWMNMFAPSSGYPTVALCHTSLCGPLPFAASVPFLGCIPDNMLTLTFTQLLSNAAFIDVTPTTSFTCNNTPPPPLPSSSAPPDGNHTTPDQSPDSLPSQPTATMVGTRTVPLGASSVGLAAGASMGFLAARAGGAMRLVECDDADTEGGTEGYALGLLIAYVAAALLCAGFVLAVSWRTSSGVVTSMRRWGMPGNFGVVACGLGPELLSSGVSLLATGSASGGVAALGAMSVVVGGAPVLALCWVTTAGFGATFLRRASGAGPAQRSLVARWRRAYEAPRAGRWVAAADRPAFVDCYGPLFDELTGGRAWYVALQCGLAAGVSVCGGVAGGAACGAMQVVGGGLQMVGLVALMVCRPLQEAVPNLCMSCAVELLGFVGGLLIVVLGLSPIPSPNLAEAASTTLQVQLWLGVGLGLLAGVMSLRNWWAGRSNRQGDTSATQLPLEVIVSRNVALRPRPHPAGDGVSTHRTAGNRRCAPFSPVCVHAETLAALIQLVCDSRLQQQDVSRRCRRKK